MKPLSRYLNEETISRLRKQVEQGHFPGVNFELAMRFILSDGILPKSDLPASSFLKLEDWIRSLDEERTVTYTASALKNKTGEILNQVLQGKTVRLSKHGRAIAEIRKL